MHDTGVAHLDHDVWRNLGLAADEGEEAWRLNGHRLVLRLEPLVGLLDLLAQLERVGVSYLHVEDDQV